MNQNNIQIESDNTADFELHTLVHSCGKENNCSSLLKINTQLQKNIDTYQNIIDSLNTWFPKLGIKFKANSQSDIVNALELIFNEIKVKTEYQLMIGVLQHQIDVISNIIEYGIVYVNFIGNIEYWNDAAEKILGFKSTQTIGTSIFNLIETKEVQELNAKSWYKTIKHNSIIRFPDTMLTVNALNSNHELVVLDISIDVMRSTNGVKYIVLFKNK